MRSPDALACACRKSDGRDSNTLKVHDLFDDSLLLDITVTLPPHLAGGPSAKMSNASQSSDLDMDSQPSESASARSSRRGKAVNIDLRMPVLCVLGLCAQLRRDVTCADDVTELCVEKGITRVVRCV